MPKSLFTRFTEKVHKPDDPEACWEWTAYRNEKGYGVIRVGGKTERAHRVAWLIFRGDIPPGLCVLHKCDVRACQNPEHLWLGTHTDNMKDSLKKGRHYNANKTHCPQGHPYSKENTLTVPIGKRHCRTCMGRRCRNYYWANLEAQRARSLAYYYRKKH